METPPDTPPDTRKFRLVFKGECYPGHDPQAVRAAVVAALKLDDQRAARMFSGRRVVLRKGVDLPAAHRYIVRLSALGAVVHAEPPLPAPAMAAAPDRPSMASDAPGWRRRGIAVVGGAVALALLIAAVLQFTGAGDGPQAAAPDASARVATAEAMVPVATPSPPVVAPSPEPAVTPLAMQTPDRPALPDDMAPEARRDYLGPYRQAPGHKAFAISASRQHRWHAGAATPAEAREQALGGCLAVMRPGDDSCRVIDEDGLLLE